MIPVQIFGREMQVDPTLEDYVTKKASKLDRYIDGVEEARVDLTFRKARRAAEDRYKAQITLKGKRFTLRSEERTDQIHSAFDAALDKMQRQIERYKGKHYRGKASAAAKNDMAMEEVIAAFQAEPAPLIARRKRFLLHPMDEGEAIEQMKLLGHDNFFVFYNMDANCVSVMYQRGDGTFGLIDTEVA
ncbi:MAG TPA: ribosome-associated translation inhibitor RaiA [Anaerolineales bacterium]|nr:ribosome-associated translation inhibitor RaiA [Anaerolineales bacterium]